MTNIERLQSDLRIFASDRCWDQFHSPKNLVMALAGEVGELVEVFQWKTEQQSRELDGKELFAAQEEVADVFLYLVRLADVLGINLEEAARDKIDKNAERYPVHLVKGRANKYTDY